MTRAELIAFFDFAGGDIVEIQPNDYWDNYHFFQWRYLSGGPLSRRIKKYLWQAINFAYFSLGMDGFLQKLEQRKPEDAFTKYLVAVRKR
jgi:hypothetical protein